MNQAEIDAVSKKIDNIEILVKKLVEERDTWKRMYYESRDSFDSLMKSSDSLMESVKQYIGNKTR